MIVLTTGFNQAKKIVLPDRISGSYHIYGYRNEVIAIISAIDNTWQITPNLNKKMFKNQLEIKEDRFTNNSVYTIVSEIDDRKYHIYIYIYDTNKYDNVFSYEINASSIKINSQNADISYASPNIKDETILTYNNNVWNIETKDSNVYVNNILTKKKRLLHGDIIFIDGLKIIPYSNRIIICNMTSMQLSINDAIFTKLSYEEQNNDPTLYTLETERSVFEGKEYFTKAPRFRSIYESKKIQITPPPPKQESKTPPTLLVIGPQLTMLLSSFINISTQLNNVATGNASISQIFPSIILSVVMAVSALLWPALTRKWNKRNIKLSNKKRIVKYRQYLQKKEQELSEELSKEKQVLIENNASLEECKNIIYDRKRNLWERDITQKDFLNVRLGIGSVKPSSSAEYTEADFSTDDDILIEQLKDMLKKYEYIDDVPQCVSLVKRDTTAIIGAPVISQKFINSMILQLMTFHSFTDLKIVIFTNKEKAPNWEYCDILPHCWNNQRSFRYIGTDINEILSVSQELMKVFKTRKAAEQKNNNETEKITDEIKKAENSDIYINYPPYYLIIIDDLELARNVDIVKTILESKVNYGFSILIKNDKISNLPSKCSSFININSDISGLFENELVSTRQKQFKADINDVVDMYGCAMQLSNIPFQLAKEKYDLPKSISFLDMYEVGNIEQLNSLNRWKNNNPISSLSVPVGIDQNGNIFNMDIHEKGYGPHGLVAGTTGSGKSEWIITYILSLAVNFNPNEVQFVLIDYKGGGLAGSFENSQIGIKLPHLVGTITNLDKSEVRRAIASIESELKRRQRLFNEAREKLKDSSMNIYKYQEYYRQGLLDEPMSHLLIISDEFAELKSQQPEFLDQLVSTARIGRSLGVHLILATQKPTGVVNEQIWSNSRFKVCLRVQDTSDSQEMLKKSDAAYLKTTGAFYLQVGNDEYYMLGQSAYAGFKYTPSNIVKKKIDTDLHVIDKNGNEIHTINEKTLEDLKAENKTDLGEELLNILKYIDKLAKEENYNPRKLWLDRIPDIIFLNDIKNKYNYKKENFALNPIIGEYDDPYTQSQKVYTIPFNEKGNTIVYGSTGSGKELFLLSLIYSISSTYTIAESNIYAIDCGAQILKSCEALPTVGNIINYENEDQVDGMLIFLRNIMKDRKILFSDYNGEYEQYIKNSGKTLPNIIVIINNMPSFMEKYPEYSEEIRVMMSSCTKYGIYVVITSTSVLNVKYSQNIGNKISLNFTDENEYRNVFGGNNKVFPAKAKARGIFEENEVIYEFQTAIPTIEENINSLIEKYGAILFQSYKTKIPSVPYLPKFITYDKLLSYVTDMSEFPIGIKKTNVKPKIVDFSKLSSMLIFGINLDFVEDYTRNIVRLMNNITNDNIYVFDAKKQLQEIVNSNITYLKDDFNETISNLAVYVNDIYDKVENQEDIDMSLHSYILINGVEKFISQISKESLEYLNIICSKLESVKNVHFIVVDSTNSLRNNSNQQWLAYLRKNAIIIGPGVAEQLLVDIRKFDIKPKRDSVIDNYAYCAIDGKAELFQIVEDIKIEEE